MAARRRSEGDTATGREMDSKKPQAFATRGVV
jgi:hypothetical protein